MARSGLSGFLVGTVVAFGGVAAVSVTQTLNTPPPEAANVDLPTGTGFDAAREDPAANVVAADPEADPNPNPNTDVPNEPSADGADDIAGVDTASAAQPETGQVDTAPAAPDAGSQDLSLGTGADTSPRTASPNQPTADIGDQPVGDVPSATQLAVPDVGDAPALGAAPAADQDGTDSSGIDDTQLAALPAEPAQAQPGTAPASADPLPTPEAGSVEAQLTPADTGVAPDLPAPLAPPLDKDTPGASIATRPDITAEREEAVIVAIPTEDPPKRITLSKPGEAVDDSPRIGTPATRLTERDDPAKIAGEPAGELTGEVSGAADDMAAETPLTAFAAPFENPDAKPLMSIVLIDRGDGAIGLDALAAFPYPLSFAVDVTSPEAKQRMERYRAAGFDVLALTDIPQGATAGDTETLLRAGLRELPEVVGVMEGDGSGLQSGKAISDSVSAVLQETGHGAVFFAQGLNTAQKLARKNGVAAVSVFRDFDSNGQTATVMRRFLDGAAFKARQTPEGVVMVGRLQAETISALLLWGLQDRATRVALAPISAVLQASQTR